MGEGRERVKGRDVVSFEFENSAGKDRKEGGGKGGRQCGAEERRGEERYDMGSGPSGVREGSE